MQAWICDDPTGVEALKWQERPTPTPGPGEVLVRIEAASLNFPDLLIVQNKYQFKPPVPFVPGAEFAGVIESVGERVQGLPGGHWGLCHPCAGACLAVPALARRLPGRGRSGLHHDLCHIAPCADRPGTTQGR